MLTIPEILTERFRQAITAALGTELADTDPLITRATQPQFGDFQANVAMGLAKRLGRNPREIAQAIVQALDWQGVLAEPPAIAGPGFINLKIDTQLLAEQATALAADPRLGVEEAEPRQRVVVDYSAPNVAKEMHIGHLRSTIIGDAIARTLGFQGHDVIRQNHLGDWGTQFGMLIEHLVDTVPADQLDSMRFEIGDLNEFYQAAKRKFDADPDFAERARRRVVALQRGDPATYAMWRALYVKSIEYFDSIYDRMNVLLTDDDIRGESAYNAMLPGVVRDLEAKGLLRTSEGARCVFPPGFEDREGNPLPLIVQKSDGGYLYATTDLAAIRYRVDELKADRIIYVTDARQAQHFAMVFATARMAGWAPPEVRLDHVPFGTILGKDRRPFRTREGGTVRLADVLDEAERRALELVTTKNPDWPEDERRRIARIVGIGALKYADLSNDRIKDYVFDWDRMLSFEGNTAPYLQYSFTRIRSIFRRAAGGESGVEAADDEGTASATGAASPPGVTSPAIRITEPAERALALELTGFGAVVADVAETLEPHRMCTYLYELAAAFHQFYERCPVLAAPDAETRASRLALCDLTARTLERGLALLGIEVPERM